jgi:hypothetical protein
MALTQLPAACLICGKAIEPESRAIFVGIVQATQEANAGFYGCRKVKDGNLRIKHLTGGKPRGLAHESCFKKVMGNET